MRWLANFYYCLSISPRFLHLYRNRSNLVTPKVQEILAQANVHLDALPSSMKKRIPLYLFSNALTAQWFSTMRGYSLTDDEKTNCQLMAISTPLFDYLSDEMQASYNQIRVFLEDPGANELLLTCSKLHQLSKQRTSRPGMFEKYFAKTMLAQERSIQQKTKWVTEDFLRQITSEKGGHALLLYRSALDHKLLDGEGELIYQLGGLMQLYNDIFDIHRDHLDGIKTMATECTSISSLRSLFQSQIDDIRERLFSLSYRKRNLKMANMLISLTLNTGFICLDQLESLEDHSGRFDVASYQRDDLICDMEKPSNMLLTLSKTLRHA